MAFDPVEIGPGEEVAPVDPKRLRMVRLAAYLNNLGRTYLLQGKPALSRKQFQEALDVFGQLQREAKPGSTDDPVGGAEHATTLSNLAFLHMQQKEYDLAEPLLVRSLAILQKCFDDKHPQYAVGLSSLGGLYYLRGVWDKAERNLRQAVEVRRQALGERSLLYAISLSNLALLHDARGEPRKALPLAPRTVEASRAQVGFASAVQSERQQLALLRAFRGQLDHYLSLALRTGVKGEEAYGPVLAWKGSVFARQQRLRERRLVHSPGMEEAAKIQTDLDDVARRLGRLALAQPVNHQEVEKLASRKEELERKLADKAAAVSDRRQAEQLTPAALQAALPADVALVDFLEFRHGAPTRRG